MAVGNDPNSKPRALLGQFYFPHPHHFRGDEVPWGGWRLQKQILIPPHDLWGFRKGVKQLERVWDKGLWRVKENTPVYSIKRSSPGKFTHREVRFLTNERYFLIQYWAKGKGEGMKGGRGFCWLPNQTPQVIDGLNRTLSLLEERWERFKEREDLVFVGAVD